MTLEQAVEIGLNYRRHTDAEITAAYDVLCNTDRWVDRDVLAAKGNIEGYLRWSVR